MPELPEVESARTVIARGALGRRIVDVDDSDTYVCRPHLPGEIRAALVGRDADRGAPARQEHVVRDVRSGRRPGARHPPRHVRQDRDRRRPRRRDRRRRLLGTRPGGRRPPVHPVLADASPTAARCCWSTRGGSAGCGWTRRWSELGPGRRRASPGPSSGPRSRRGTAPVKARLLDQDAIAGIGNLLADQALWQARINPRRPVDELTPQRGGPALPRRAGRGRLGGRRRRRAHARR